MRLRDTRDMGTPVAEAMRAVVTWIAPPLKEAGFRKRRHTFNRRTDQGVVHVIDFQMGRVGPGDDRNDFDSTHGLYGKFTVNVAVDFPRIDQPWVGEQGWVSSAACPITGTPW